MLQVTATHFRSDRSGSVIPLFGLCFMFLVMITGVAVDSARGFRTASEASVALDAAALATAKALRIEKASDAELDEIANAYFKQNFTAKSKGDATFSKVSVAVDRVTNTVKLAVDLSIATSAGAVIGQSALNIGTKSTAVYDSRNVELSMMLDVSGSMAGSKIVDLRDASKDLVELLLNANQSGADHRIAIAPFATSVNVGEYAEEILPSGGKKSSCAAERKGANAFKDKNPKAGGPMRKAASCPVAAILPLSNDEAELEQRLDEMAPNGMTAGHLGIAWAWYLLSPEWSSIWPGASEPKSYDNPEYTKVAIIMTDGEFNTSYEEENGNSQTQARKLCDNMKAGGLTIYTVGFQVPAAALPVLQYCATSPNHFFDAKNGTQLRETFQNIARKLSGLRLAS